MNIKQRMIGGVIVFISLVVIGIGVFQGKHFFLEKKSRTPSSLHPSEVRESGATSGIISLKDRDGNREADAWQVCRQLSSGLKFAEAKKQLCGSRHIYFVYEYGFVHSERYD